jgi:uncharacterized membrane protein YqjE
MLEDNPHSPGVIALLQKLVRTGTAAFHNRAELLAVEWQEERAWLAELFIWTAALVFFGMIGTLLLTLLIIFICPESARLYVAAGFTLLYFGGAIAAWLSVKSLLKREPFRETLGQVRKDRLWLESSG